MNRVACLAMALLGVIIQNTRNEVKPTFDSQLEVAAAACSNDIDCDGFTFEFDVIEPAIAEDVENECSMGWLVGYQTPTPEDKPVDRFEASSEVTPQVTSAKASSSGAVSYGSVGSAVLYGSTGASYGYGSSGSSYGYSSVYSSKSPSYGSSGSGVYSSGPVRTALGGLKNILARRGGGGKSLANTIASTGQAFHDESFAGRENVYLSSSNKVFGHRRDARQAWRASDGHRANLPMVGLRVSRGPGGVAVVGRGR